MKRLLAPLLALSLVPAPAFADDIAHPLPASERQLASLRPVAVVVPQERIRASVEIGRIAPDANGGGLIGALIIGAMDNKREIMTRNASERAEGEIAPLVAALSDFDVSALALETTRKSIGSIDWFGADKVELIDGEYQDFVAFAQANPSEQLGRITYSYHMSPDFTQLEVIAVVDTFRSETQTAIGRQTVTSLVRLRKRSYENHENVAAWAQDDGARAKAALTAAFARLETAIPAALALDDKSFDEATDKRRESATVATFHGPVLVRDATGPVIWSKKDGFIAGDTLTF